MHNDTPGAVISYRGHTLTADEWHSAMYGLVGLLVGAVEEINKPLRREPLYFLGVAVLSYLLGRYLSHRQDNQAHAQ